VSYIRDRITARHYATPHPYDVIVYTENNNYYAKDSRGNLVCVDSPTACLQEAINYIYATGGGKVFVRKGVYYPNSTVQLPDGINIIIEGEGANTVFKYTNQFNLFQHSPTSPTWTSIIMLRNFKIDRTGSGTNNVDIIVINYAKLVMYDGIEIVDDWRNSDGDAGLTGYNNLIAIAQNNRVFNKSYGIWLFGYLSIMKHNYVNNTAKVGIAGAGLLPNWQLPPNYSPGGITVIADNVCIDCGRTDEAIAVDYLANNPVVNAIGIIRNNLIVGMNYSINNSFSIVSVSHAMIVNNKVDGKVGSTIIVTPKSINYLEVNGNIINITPTSSYIRPVMNASRVIFKNNTYNVTSNLTTNVNAQIDVYADELLFEGNRIEMTYPTGYYTGYIINIAPLGNTDFTAHIFDNYFNVPVNPNLACTVIVYGSQTVYIYVWFKRNYIKSTTNSNAFLGLSGNTNSLIYYAYVKHNIVSGSLANKVAIWNDTSGQTTKVIYDGDAQTTIGSGGIINYTRNSGIAVFSGNGTTTQFAIPHNLASTPNKVIVTPGSANATGQFYVTADSTYIYINYLTAPPSGTNNIVLYWYAEI
jgi:hypothetical protein